MKTQVQKFLKKVFWPWFRKQVWPLIREAVADIALQAITLFVDRVQQAASDVFESRRSRAAENAAAAAAKAEASTSPSEDEKYRAIAQVWREVAEMHRIDKEELEQKLEQLMSESSTSVRDAYDALEPSADFSESSAVIAIASRQQALPLPSNTDLAGDSATS